jgi:TRAP-type mannitol/chloroaromatic compound transport system permease small subunit
MVLPDAAREARLKTLLRYDRAVDAVSIRIGQWAAWDLVAAAILGSARHAALHKTFNASSNTRLEIQ